MFCDYDINLRALGGGSVSGWAQANISSKVSPSTFLSSGAKWNESNTQRNSTDVITFRFADSLPSYYDPADFSNVGRVGEQIEAIFESIFTPTSSGKTSPWLTRNIPIRFEMSDSETADIQIFTADQSDSAFGKNPGLGAGGDIVLNRELFSGTSNPVPGSQEYFAILRSVATAMGIGQSATGLNREQSVVGVSESESLGDAYLSSFGDFDTRHLMELYGAIGRFPLLGTNRFVLGDPANGSFTSKIAEASSSSMITAADSDLAVRIDLREGETSQVLGDGLSQRFIIGSGTSTEMRRAWGGNGDDLLIGNHGVNHVEGGLGADTLRGLGGADILAGGGGNDLYLYETGDGNDTVEELGGTDTLQIRGKFGMDSLSDDLSFWRTDDDLTIDLDMNGQFNKNDGRIKIKGMGSPDSRLEKLDLRSFTAELGVISLPSIWNAATTEKQRFALTADTDAFGIVAAPV
ncbi:MAG: calcium-binding protein [Mariniblastus sp.]